MIREFRILHENSQETTDPLVPADCSGRLESVFPEGILDVYQDEVGRKDSVFLRTWKAAHTEDAPASEEDFVGRRP
jgi:hypothetical protein